MTSPIKQQKTGVVAMPGRAYLTTKLTAGSQAPNTQTSTCRYFDHSYDTKYIQIPHPLTKLHTISP